MGKKLMVITLGLLVSGSIFAAHSRCFRPYRAEIINKSGGTADVKKVRGLSGLTRKDEIENNNTVTVMIKKRGAELDVTAGPEENKYSKEIEFYSKEPNTFSAANVMLNPKGIATSGFNTTDKPYQVKVMNESGGLVQITDSCGVSDVSRKLSDGKSMNISVKPDGYIMVQSGPENRKINYRVHFADKTGDNPTITFVKRGFMSSGIQHKNLDIQTRRVFAYEGFAFPKVTFMAAKKIRGKKISPTKTNDAIDSLPERRHVRRAQ